MGRLLSLYHKLPAPARSAPATLRGFYLRFWRQGPGSKQIAQATIERDTWSAEQWRRWQEERLGYLLQRAATRVPYYRDLWQAQRDRGERVSWDRLEHWPVLDKEPLRADPRAFIADDCDARRMYVENTSGTTGKPLRIWRTRSTLTAMYSISAARTIGWYGIPTNARMARFGGQLVTPARQRKPPFWVWNAAMQQLYMSTYHLSPSLIPYYLDALVRYRIVYIAGYTSALCALAREALRLGRRDLQMAAAFTNAESISAEQRELIGAAFQCPVCEEYGMGEGVAAASQCPAGSLHRYPEFGHIEVVNEDGPVPAGEVGDLVCTGLLNPDMPLIRYRVGDRGRLAPPGTRCECGRTLPVVLEIAGRINDLLITRDGRQVARLGAVFHHLPVRESQIVQESLDRLHVLVAPAPEFTDDAARTIRERLRERVGEMEVSLEYVETVPRTANGKVRTVVCQLEPAQRDTLLGRANT
jgi:phenylacetate-CoA ligase